MSRSEDNSELIEDLLLDIQEILSGTSHNKLLDFSGSLNIDREEIIQKSRLSMVRLLLAEVERKIDREQNDSS